MENRAVPETSHGKESLRQHYMQVPLPHPMNQGQFK